MELIDKNALVKYLEGMGNEIYAGNDEYFLGQKTGLAKAVSVILTFPTVEERQHGYWKNGCCTVCGECPLTYPVGFYRNLPFSVDKSKGCCILVCEIEDPNIRLIDCPLIEIKEHEEK